MPAIDNYQGSEEAVVFPAENAEAITPHDTNELNEVTRGLYVGAGGDAVVVFKDGTEVTLVGLQTGVLYPFRIRQVKATGTNATNLIGVS